MKIRIIFGTESGESEMVAEEISEELASCHDVVVENMQDVDIRTIDTDSFYLVVCSTHGEGELPESAVPFYESLEAHRPDLSELRYAMLGRGDRTYAETYSQGSEHIDRLLTELGAVRVGEYGREDASDWSAPEDLVVQWAFAVIEEFSKEGIAS